MKFMRFNVTGPQPIEFSPEFGGLAKVGGYRCDAIVLGRKDVTDLANILRHGSEVQRAALLEVIECGWMTAFSPGAQ